jgi:pyridoxal phosphate enzyme (YggS family)
MGLVSENLQKILNELPNGVKLIAVSKRQPDEKLQEAYDTGHRIFGENIVQELVRKHELFPDDIQWHMIGHLQKNKVKYIAPFISMIHSVDDFDLAKEINKRAEKNERIIDCLFEIHIAKEESKFGFKPESLKAELEKNDWKRLFPNIRFRGLMTMATNTTDKTVIRNEFKAVRELFEELKRTYFKGDEYFNELSMGMSNDYKIAIEEGSTMVRLGTIIFGERLPK